LTAQPYFAGRTYSEGDAYISDLQKRIGSKGNAAKWRWASTDHHLTVNVEAIAEMYGMAKAIPTVVREPTATQIDMFAELDSPATVPEPQFERLVESRSPDDEKK